jgi:hypothetical protein
VTTQGNGHTPGPWQWWTSNSWRRLKRDGHGITQNVLEPYVCKDGHPDCSVSEADMRLIAAAPDELDALRAFVTAAQSWHDFHHGSNDIACDWLCECIAPGIAALTKAGYAPPKSS